MRGIVLFKKTMLIAAAALLCLTCLLALTACGEANKSIIKTGLTNDLEQLKDPNSDLWRQAIESTGGALTTEFVSAWSKSYSFEIGEITVEGKTATAQISITCKQLLPVIQSAPEILLSSTDLTGLTEDEVTKKLQETFLSELDKAQPETTEIVVSCELIDNTWEPDAQATSEFEKALLGSA
jgi:hypothetical protein